MPERISNYSKENYNYIILNDREESSCVRAYLTKCYFYKNCTKKRSFCEIKKLKIQTQNYGKTELQPFIKKLR